MPLSQYDIARVTGLSRSTVSRALSNHPSISPETRQKVKEAAEELGYRKNALVSLLTAQLRASHTKSFHPTIAYINSVSEAYLKEQNRDYVSLRYYTGAQDRAAELGYRLDFINRSEKGMTDSKLQSLLRARGIRGVLIAPRIKPLGRLRLQWQHFAAVSIAHALPCTPIHYSCPAYFNNLGTALRAIAKLRYRRIAFAVSQNTDAFAHLSYSARFAIHSQGLSREEQIPGFVAFGKDMDKDVAAFEQWFCRHRPGVIIHAGTTIPYCLKTLGISVPDDVATCDLLLPGRSEKRAGIDQLEEMAGMAAVDLVVEQLHHNELGIPRFQKVVSIQGEWISGPTLPRTSNSTSDLIPVSS